MQKYLQNNNVTNFIYQGKIRILINLVCLMNWFIEI